MNPLRLLLAMLFLAAVATAAPEPGPGPATERPNILWLTCEDMGPHLGAYGDSYATTPNLDRLAAEGLRYRIAWSNAPVCAPARTALVTGMYPSTTGAEAMRSLVRFPPGMRMFPQFLREAGYYCTNNSKEDYNLEKPGPVWDESSPRAHWRNRKPGQPFFAVFNFTVTHESQIRARPHRLVHDPAGVRLPAYHPDTPEVRRDWAQYYDNITEMDRQAGERLRELEAAGLADDTIVFFFSDHGSGMPRSKRFPYNSGLQVPLIVRVPPKWRALAPRDYAPGAATDRLVSFVDFAPTLLSLAGIRPPAWMQGQAFMGPFEAAPRRFLFGMRSRMDERLDLIRSVRDGRYIYIRNYMPHRIYGQHVAYMFETPTTRVWKRLYDEGKLAPPRTAFWERKPPEELYDLETDPDEVRNLAASREGRRLLGRFRAALRDHLLETRDLSFLTEAEMHRRAGDASPFELGQDERRYPLRRILDAAERAASLRPERTPWLRQALGDGDSGVRYWAALGLLMRGREAVRSARAELRRALEDESASVRVAAAEALAASGDAEDARRAVATLAPLAPLRQNGFYVSLLALNALDELDDRALPVLEVIRRAAEGSDQLSSRLSSNLPRLVEKTVSDLSPFR